MLQPISITAIASISPLGCAAVDIRNNSLSKDHFIKKKTFENTADWVSELSPDGKKEIELIRESDSKYSKLDDTVLFGLYAARKAVKRAGWQPKDNFGINIGSSRGATSLFEKYHRAFIDSDKAATLTSPTTTLGNISSWVAHDLKTQGPEISHSITCSTALHALLNGIAWINSGMASKFLVGGSEAPLTPFTLAQMKALKIYSSTASIPLSYPCRALDLDKKQNSMVLGEGAAVACLEIGVKKNAVALIEGIGYATEVLEHNISISSDAKCFQRSMQMALGSIAPKEVDAIVMHAPGTIKGDASELKAIQEVFGESMPALTTNKWKIGHTFGASGMLSVELAALLLQHQEFSKVPFVEYESIPDQINKVLVNSVGFGGNAVSVLLSKK